MAKTRKRRAPVPIDKKGAHALVLSCIDPRFTAHLASFLRHEKDVLHDYDLVTLAGASLGVTQTKYPCWRSMFFKHIDLAIALHGIKTIWVVDHLDCGMYKQTLGRDDEESHTEQLFALKATLKRKYPRLGFRGYLMDTKGEIHTVI
jgi:carbonic anhydrase